MSTPGKRKSRERFTSFAASTHSKPFGQGRTIVSCDKHALQGSVKENLAWVHYGSQN